MIGKVLRSGGSTGGLVRYLFGPGTHNEHLNPRIVASWDPHAALDKEQVIALLDATARAAHLTEADRGVYHLVLASAKADEQTGLGADRALSDEEWAGIAEDALTRTGLIGHEDVGKNVRWVAVRHDEPGKEHVHVVATLATEDGRRVNPRNDFYRVGEACRAAEEKHGLRATAARDRTSVSPPSRAETERAARSGREPTRVTLRRDVRTAAAGAGSESEFFDRLSKAGLLVKERHSTLNGERTGYAVALPGQGRAAGQPVWFSGGKLAADLSLPKLRARWTPSPPPPPGVAGLAGGAPVVGREEVWQSAVRAAEAAARAVRAHATDPGGAADAAWAGSDFLTSAARRLDGRRGGLLEAAARDFDRAAREAYGRTPAPRPAGGGLRASARLLVAAQLTDRPDSQQLLALLAALTALADAVARMRAAQARAAQAEAAQRAAAQLQRAAAQHQPRTAAPATAQAQSRAAARAAALDADRHSPTQFPPGPSRGARR